MKKRIAQHFIYDYYQMFLRKAFFLLLVFVFVLFYLSIDLFILFFLFFIFFKLNFYLYIFCFALW